MFMSVLGILDFVAFLIISIVTAYKYIKMHPVRSISLQLAAFVEQNKKLTVAMILLPVIGQWNGFFNWSPHFRHPISMSLFLQMIINITIYTLLAIAAFRANLSWPFLALFSLYTFSFLIGDFAGIYWGSGTTQNWSIQLSHLDAIFLAFGVLSTMGAGDITPKTEVARRLMLIQMMVDFIVVTMLVGLLVSVAVNKIAVAKTRSK